MKPSAGMSIGFVFRHEVRLMRQDVGVLVILLIMPLILILFLKNAVIPPPAAQGVTTSGADQAIPGIAIMFGFFIVGTTGFSIFREYTCHTWDRLRTLPITSHSILVGKLAFYFPLGCLQLGVLFLAGKLWMGMTISGSPWTLVPAIACSSFAAVSLGMLLVTITDNVQQLSTIANLLAVVCGGIAGALAPIGRFPGWAQTVAHFTPQYWLIKSLIAVLVSKATLTQVGGDLVVVFVFGLLFLGIAIVRFDGRQPNQSLKVAKNDA